MRTTSGSRILFVLFIGMLWVATGRVGYLVLGLVLFGVGAFIAAHPRAGHVQVEGVAEPVAHGDQPETTTATS